MHFAPQSWLALSITTSLSCGLISLGGASVQRCQNDNDNDNESLSLFWVNELHGYLTSRLRVLSSPFARWLKPETAKLTIFDRRRDKAPQGFTPKALTDEFARPQILSQRPHQQHENL
jgi:hypothetical protein